MNNLLVWPLSNNAKLQFIAPRATLSTVTCCDKIDIVLQVDEQTYSIFVAITGCQLTELKKLCIDILLPEVQQIAFKDRFIIKKSQIGLWLLDIQDTQGAIAYFLIDIDMIQAWEKQLDLLEVVMQENENEKKARGKGCC